jgi:carboxymethylenebutenolidase
MQVPAEKVPGIKAPLLLHYAGIDERVNAYNKEAADLAWGRTVEFLKKNLG